MVDIFVKDKESGRVFRAGDDTHDMLTIDDEGQLHYTNLQNGDGCSTAYKGGGYEFVPNMDDHGYAYDPREGC